VATTLGIILAIMRTYIVSNMGMKSCLLVCLLRAKSCFGREALLGDCALGSHIQGWLLV